MWPFKRPAPPASVLERLDTLERGHKLLRMEWEETYDKVVRALGRINKRAALIAQAQEEVREDAPGSPAGGQVPSDPFSEQVRALRRRGGA